jgi:integrase
MTNGKPIRKTLYGKTRQEVAKKVTALTGEVFEKGYTTVSARDERNFQVLMQEWFDLFSAPNIASTTEYNRRSMLNNHIFKAFGSLDIQNVTLERLQRFFNAKIKAGTAADSVHKMKDLLKLFFKYAVRKKFIRENPMDDVVIRCRVQHCAKGSGREKALREEVREQVFAGLAENSLLRPKILVFTFTGLRPQELLALEWRHVDFARKTLSVKQAVNRVYEFDDAGKKISGGEAVGETKTPGSVRDVWIPDVVFEVLLEWQAYCKEHGIVSTYVFPNTKTGGRLSYSGLRTSLQRFISRHKLEAEKITLYSFRHTYASMSMEEGIHARIVADMMGHKKASMVYDVYSHVTDDSVYEKTAQTLDGVFRRYSL